MENKRLNEPDYIQELVALIRSNRSRKRLRMNSAIIMRMILRMPWRN